MAGWEAESGSARRDARHCSRRAMATLLLRKNVPAAEIVELAGRTEH